MQKGNPKTHRTSELDPTRRDDESRFDIALRPTTLKEFIGQKEHKDNLKIFIEAAKKRVEPLDHLLLYGPPGLGKTTLAHIIANEMGVAIHVTSGPAIEHKGILAGLLTNLSKCDVLFIDEIHRLNAAVEESLYPALEDFSIDVVTSSGPHAQTIKLRLTPFTLIGATTRSGLLTGPLRSRFGLEMRLNYYPVEDMKQIVKRSAKILRVKITDDAAAEIARRSRATPRIANRLLRRVRDFADILSNGRIETEITRKALERLRVDSEGMDEMDRRYLRIIIEKFDGGPVGIETISAALGEPKDTIEEIYEPFLLQGGWIKRTPRGRETTLRAYKHLGISPPKGKQGLLF